LGLRIVAVAGGGAGILDLLEILYLGSAQNAPHVFARNVALVFAVNKPERLKR